MSGKAAFFPTGKNCKIKVNGVTLAYAVDLSYTVSIPHATPKTLGTYEANSLEPMSYNVTGRFTIVRYTEGAVKRLSANNLVAPNGSNNDGNGIGSWTVNRSGSGRDILSRTVGNFSNDGKAQASLDPSQLQEALTFDIEVYQRLPVEKSPQSLGGFISSLGTTTLSSYSGLSRIRSCRITQMDAAVPVKGVMTQTFQFVAQYLDEDSFVADSSGIGQLFS